VIKTKEKPNSEEELINVLHPIVKKWFFSKFKTFSLPQLFGVMEIHSRNNILVSAPTGATKTLTDFCQYSTSLLTHLKRAYWRRGYTAFTFLRSRH
jgi:ATP-dependent helicase Lhr and Lhr-like helicase